MLLTTTLVGALVAPFQPLSLAASPALQAETKPTQAELDARFEKQLSGVRLVGWYTDSNRPDGKLTKDSYTITKVSRAESGKWRFEASVEFGERAVPLSMEMPVEWAGETPVISVTDIQTNPHLVITIVALSHASVKRN